LKKARSSNQSFWLMGQPDAAVVFFGKTFMPDYPQCELRMARFRGLDKTEFLDQRQIRGPAFKLLEEAELFCQRHFPLPGRIEPGKLQRVDRPLIPPGAMREILVNAFIHRDYTIAGGAVSLAIFDDRVEIWSAGRYPTGITAEMGRDLPNRRPPDAAAARVAARVTARVAARVAARVTAKVSAKGERGGSRESGCWTA
jgi:ATP-dependent DNA helicase RecG